MVLLLNRTSSCFCSEKTTTSNCRDRLAHVEPQDICYVFGKHAVWIRCVHKKLWYRILWINWKFKVKLVGVDIIKYNTLPNPAFQVGVVGGIDKIGEEWPSAKFWSVLPNRIKSTYRINLCKSNTYIHIYIINYN